jgi:hypothetical protein
MVIGAERGRDLAGREGMRAIFVTNEGDVLFSEPSSPGGLASKS